MPRIARLKTPDNMFHIMIHSISEINLFRDTEDKDMYLHLIETCKLKYPFKVYAFCLMDTHAHFIFDCFGSDISKIMHYLNLCYSMYYNKKYARRGPLFHDRFKSKIIDSYRYLANLSLYIHRNPLDLLKEQETLLSYPYNSLIDYIHGSNRFSILDLAFLTHTLGLSTPENRRIYLQQLDTTLDPDTLEELELPLILTQTQNEKTYLSRIISPEIILHFIASKFQLSPTLLHVKYNHKLTHFRAACCFMLNSFSSLSHKSICKLLGNITQSRVSNLIAKGLELSRSTSWVEEFIKLNYIA
ncbi:MAG: transposase [Cellulosilyticaceae bacterium]